MKSPEVGQGKLCEKREFWEHVKFLPKGCFLSFAHTCLVVARAVPFPDVFGNSPQQQWGLQFQLPHIRKTKWLGRRRSHTILGSVISRCLCQATPSLGGKKKKNARMPISHSYFLSLRTYKWVECFRKEQEQPSRERFFSP